MTAIFDEYANRLERLERHAKTIGAFSVASTRFQAWCTEQGHDPEQLEPHEIEEYFATLPFTPATKRNHLVHVSAAYNYAVTRGVLTRNPCRLVELPRVADTTPRILTSKELREMWAQCETDEQKLVFRLYAYTGMRQAEGCSVHWDAINRENRTIEVIGKGGKRRLIPIHPALGELLGPMSAEGWLFPGRKAGRPINESTMHNKLRKITPTATFHDFRRTVASSLDANGVEEGLIFKIMGWSRNTVFDRHYRNVAPDRLHAAILRLYADSPL